MKKSIIASMLLLTINCASPIPNIESSQCSLETDHRALSNNNNPYQNLPMDTKEHVLSFLTEKNLQDLIFTPIENKRDRKGRHKIINALSKTGLGCAPVLIESSTLNALYKNLPKNSEHGPTPFNHILNSPSYIQAKINKYEFTLFGKDILKNIKTSIKPGSMRELGLLLRDANRVKSLNLSGLENKREEFLPSFTVFLSQLDKIHPHKNYLSITSLTTPYNGFSKETLLRLAATFPNLEQLILYNISPTNIEQTLPRFNSLKSISIDREFLEEAHINAIGKNCPKLQELHFLPVTFPGVEPSPIDWNNIEWNHFTQLTHLHCLKDDLNTETIKKIRESLGSNVKITISKI